MSTAKDVQYTRNKTAFTVTDSLLNTLVLIQASVTITYNLGPQTDHIHDRLLKEKTDTETWLNKLRNVDTSHLSTIVHSYEFEKILNLLEKLRIYYDQANSDLRPAEPSGEQSLRGYDNLKGLLTTATEMNEILSAIAPNFQPYSKDRSAQTMTTPSSAQNTWTGDVFSRRSSIDKLVSSSQTLQETKNPGPGPSLKKLYRTALTSCVKISSWREDARLARATGRLRLWGAGLFEGPFNIEPVLQSNIDRFRRLTDCIAQNLIVVLLWAEHVLLNKANEQKSMEPMANSMTAQDITILLGKSEWVYFACASSWSIGEHDEERDIENVACTIEDMFGLLGPIAAAKKIFALQSHATTLENKAFRQMPSSLIRSIDETKAKLIMPFEDQLEQVEGIIKARDAALMRQYREVPLGFPIFRRERNNLHEFYDYISHKRLPDMTHEKIRQKGQDFIKTLSEFINNDTDHSTSFPAQPDKKHFFTILSSSSIRSLRRRKKGQKEDKNTKEIIDQMIRMNAELQKILD